MEPVKLCPLKNFKPCKLGECAWCWNGKECAIASLGVVDHTLDRILHLLKPPEASKPLEAPNEIKE